MISIEGSAGVGGVGTMFRAVATDDMKRSFYVTERETVHSCCTNCDILYVSASWIIKQQDEMCLSKISKVLKFSWPEI